MMPEITRLWKKRIIRRIQTESVSDAMSAVVYKFNRQTQIRPRIKQEVSLPGKTSELQGLV